MASLLVGFLAFVYWQEQRDVSARANVLRQFFGLSADTKFTEIRSISKSSVNAPRVEAIVRFSESQFNAYAATLDTPSVWPRGVPEFDDAPLEVIFPANMKWRDLPLPPYAGNRPVRGTDYQRPK
jgi:hypothetical protein